MKKHSFVEILRAARKSRPAAPILVLLLAASTGLFAQHAMEGMVDGITGTVTVDGDTVRRSFTLSAGSTYISTPEGNSVYVWGFAGGHMGRVQYPGPTLIVDEGDVVTVNLMNRLSEPVSIVFPGHTVTAAAGMSPTRQGALTLEAGTDGSVSYTFTAEKPGTYLYNSGTRQDLQVEMGLFGAIIVRPENFDHMAPTAYGHPDSAYDREYLFLLSEIDPVIHRLVERGNAASANFNSFFPVYWFINGRAAPDTMYPAFAGWLPAQPYNCMPMMYPGEKVLFRVIGAGRDLHPLHYHGNHARVIARDGRPLDIPAETPDLLDLTYELFTIQTVPGQTTDAIFTWTGEGIGWDIYGHAPSAPLAHGESAADHGKPFPVLLPDKGNLTFGGFWSGSPFLGSMGSLPPGEGGLNPMGGFTYMIHSHTEKEMTNNNIFPGGLMTMLMVMPHAMPMAEPPFVQGETPLMGGQGGN